MKLENLASNIVNCSIGLTAISSLCVFFPNPNIKQVAAFGVGLGFSGIAATQTITSKATKEIDRVIKTSRLELDENKNALTTASNLLNQKQKELNQTTEINHKLVAEIKTLLDTQTARTLELEALRDKVEDLSNRLIQAGKFTKDEAINLVTATFDNSIKKLDALLNALQRTHPAIANSFNNLRVEIEKFKNYYLEQLENYQGLTDLQELLDTGLVLQEKIIERSCDLKLKAQTMIIWHLNEKINDSVSFEEYERNLQQLGEKAANEIRQRELDKQAIAQEWVESNEQTVYNYETNFAEVMNIAKYSAHKQQELIVQIEKLEIEVADLSKPIMWQIAPNQTTKTGNAIIQYAKSRGIHLDRSHYEGDVYSAKLYFFHDRINPAATVDIKALSEDAEKIAQNMHLLEPVQFSYDYESRLVVAEISMQYKLSESKKKLDPVARVHEFRKPAEALITFIQEASHIGLWGQTKAGKTTAISNIVGGMIQELGGTPTIRLTIPKIEAETQKLFPVAHWIGVDESIFGLLEAALEIQYRLEKNKQAYRAKEIIQDFEPVLYFIDEINLIFRRWRSICEDDMIAILDKFESTLDGERLDYFRESMRTELINYKGQFASRLLLFIWQTGRSLNVKSLISGQNLMPAAFGFHKTDLENCSYIMMGRSIKKGMEYKVDDVDLESISSQHNTLKQAIKTEINLQYTALYSPAVGEAYFGILPPPNYYKWDAKLLTPQVDQVIPPVAAFIETKIAETRTDVDVRRAVGENMIQNEGDSTQRTSNTKSFKLFEQRDLLAEKYQNLEYKGYSDLLASLPKKGDGRVNKVKAYGTVFKVWKPNLRKAYSAFIDWLETNFK